MKLVTTLRRITAGLVLPCVAAAQAVGSEPAMRDGYILSIDSARIHYVERGHASSAPALLLIPGWGMDASIWKAQVDAFSPTHRVIAIDPRSQGQSTKTGDGNTPEGRARDLDALVRQLGLERIVLVGWSQGVQDVAAYVDAFGTGRIAGLVLVDAPVAAGAAAIELNPKASQQLLQRMGIYAAYPGPYLAGMMDAIFARPLAPAEKERRVAIALQTPTSTGIAMLMADLLTTDRRPALAKFDRPTLVVASATSSELDEQKAMAARIPHAQLAVVQDAGHAVFVDQPEQFNRALGAFIVTLMRR